MGWRPSQRKRLGDRHQQRRLQGTPGDRASRTEKADGKTSPEELIASAHASCFAMALSFALNNGGTPPERLEVTATVTFESVPGGFKVKSSALDVKGKVPGIDEAKFEATAQGAKDGCPVSQALRGNVELSVKAHLEK